MLQKSIVWMLWKCSWNKIVCRRIFCGFSDKSRIYYTIWKPINHRPFLLNARGQFAKDIFKFFDINLTMQTINLEPPDISLSCLSRPQWARNSKVRGFRIFRVVFTIVSDLWTSWLLFGRLLSSSRKFKTANYA